MRGVLLPLLLSAWGRIAGVALLALVLCPGVRAEPAKPRPPRATAPKRARSPATAGVTYTVRGGDTLWSVARRHGVPLDALRQANGLAPREGIRAGQHLVIPGSSLDPGRQEPPSMAEIVLTPPAEAPTTVLGWPVVAPVLSGFGPRGDGWHGGLDLRAERGQPVRAAAPGMVVTSGWERGYGNVVKVWHAGELMTVYAHNHENYVRVGDWVERGQVIGTVGATGRATAPHLHFEVRLSGRKYDPRYWLPDPSALEVAASLPGGPSRVR